MIIFRTNIGIWLKIGQSKECKTCNWYISTRTIVYSQSCFASNNNGCSSNSLVQLGESIESEPSSRQIVITSSVVSNPGKHSYTKVSRKPRVIFSGTDTVFTIASCYIHYDCLHITQVQVLLKQHSGDNFLDLCITYCRKTGSWIWAKERIY